MTYASAQLLGNDSDVEGDALTIASVTSGTGGTAVLNGDGTVSFTPNAGFTGTAGFTYVASDGSLLSNTAFVTVAVAAVGGDGAIDIEKYVKLASDDGRCDDDHDHHHKGNEGVGNGEDPPPPGHDYNQNDGPGTGPGNPGSGTKTKGGDDERRDAKGYGHDDDRGGRDDDDCESDDRDGEHHGEDGSNSHGWYGLDADNAPGLSAIVGREVTFTYVVTNPGDTVISNVMVVDDNETPALPDDDFAPTPVLKKGFNAGDIDRDGLLDPGEAWLYSWTTVVTEGRHVNVASVTGTLVGGGGTVSDSDPANWVGVDDMTASLGNMVWNDRDADGIQDAGERGIKGVIVNLLDENATVVATSVTDASGSYRFTGLAAGTYAVAVAPDNFAPGGSLAGWDASPQDRGASEAKDSDGDPFTFRSAPVELAAGQQKSDVDFGFGTRFDADACGRKSNGGDGHDGDPWGKPRHNDDHRLAGNGLDECRKVIDWSDDRHCWTAVQVAADNKWTSRHGSTPMHSFTPYLVSWQSGRSASSGK